nr:retrovirus-related Pol polyprotein from transposon TNT 1-94 [Tanacetum cinerariifolium]
MNVAGVRENVGSLVVQQCWIQCFNYTDEEIDEQELEAHYSYMAKIQEVPTADLGTDSELLEQYVESLEKEIDELESDKAEFSNMYDTILQEYKWVPKPKKQWVPKSKMQWVPKAKNDNVQKRIVQLILFIVDSGCTKHMTGNLKLLCNFIEKFLDDYSRYTWTLFLRSKDEKPEVLKEFLTMIQRNLQAPVITVRTDRGTEFLNKTLNSFFKEEGIEHQTSTARTPEQNSVVERQNHHPLEQVRRNPSRLVQTRRQLATDLEMCMYALTVSTAEPKNIKEAMADSAWIEAMQEELH